jgi:hypothetical protein
MVRIVPNRAAGLALLALLVLLALYGAHLAFGLGGSGSDKFFANGIYNAIMVGATLTCLARGILEPAERAVWLTMGIALAFTTTADIYYTLAFSNAEEVPYPSIADAFYLAFFPTCYIALGLLFRMRVGSFAPSLWLDGVVAGLTVAAVASGLVFQTVLDATSGSAAAVATNLAYPLADFILLAIVVGAIAASGWRIDRTWALLLAAFVIYVVVDGVYLYQSSVGTYEQGTLLDLAWPLAATVLAVAAWQPSKSLEASIEGWAALALPPVFALVSIAALAFNEISDINGLAVALAVGALLAVLGRLALTFRENLSMLFETKRLNGIQGEYIEEVGHVVDAAAAVEAQTFESESLDEVAERDDALGQLARVFQRMAREVYQREQRLKEQVQQLRIAIDEQKAAKQVAEITETDYFRDLQKRASGLRLDTGSGPGPGPGGE